MFSASERYRHCLRLGVGGRWDAAQRAALQRVGAIATAMAPQGPAPGPQVGVLAT